MRTICALALALPLAAAAQTFQGRPPGFAEAFRTMDYLADPPRRSGLEQALVLPERPGQNQVAWYDFRWEYVDVPPPGGGKGGIRLYFYRSEAAQARRALPAIRSAFARLVDVFHYNPTHRIPYFLFATQREFQTQNVFQVSESVLGVTSPEDLKMTVPYFGDHARFVEVSTHEMVHQFQIQKMLDQAGPDHARSAIEVLPLWFTEGIAEYYSKGGIDSETDLFLRDLVWNPDPRHGYEILPFAEDRIRGYIPTYKLGQARCAFIAETYGREKIQAIIENAYLLTDSDGRSSSSTRGFGALVRRVFNEPLEQVDARWHAWLKRRYYAEYLRARQDLPSVRDIRNLPYEPEDFAVSPDGMVAAVRGIDRARGRARLYLVDLRNPKASAEIASDGEPGFESLHPVEYSIAAVGKDVVLFSAEDGIGDRLYAVPYRRNTPQGKLPTVSLGRRRVVDVRPPGAERFIQISDPALSPDGREIAFVGVTLADGQQDLWVASVGGGVARRLTDDPYAKKDLSWGPAGIYFASDATDHGRLNLFRISPTGGDRVRLTTGPSSDRHPAALPDGSVLYSSDAGGKIDLYLLENGTTRQITDFSTGLVAPAPSPKGRGVYATTFFGGRFKMVEVPSVAWIQAAPTPIPPPGGAVLAIPLADLPEPQVRYDANSLRNWSPEAGFIYGGGAGSAVAGRAAILFADLLRDRQLFVDVSVLGAWEYTQALALYEDRSSRISKVFGAYHFVQQNLDRLDTNLVYYQRDVGVVGALRYPLDRFRRLEAELSLSAIQRYCLEDYSGLLTLSCGGISDPTLFEGSPYADVASWRSRNGGTNFSISPTVRWGYDTIRYDYFTGPLQGHSVLAELGGGWLPGRSATHGFFHLDAQQYFQLIGRANIGLRAALGTSFSPDARSRIWERTWWLSSADNLRGFYPFDLENLIGANFYVANAELQIPLDAVVRIPIFDYVEGVAALDFGGVFDRWTTRRLQDGTLRRSDVGAWDARSLTGVLGVNVLFGPLLLRVHFGHPYDIGGLKTPALLEHSSWVTNVTLRWFFM